MPNPMRVVIYVVVTDIPGEALRRHTTLGEDFCQQILKREFHPQQGEVRDGVTVQGEFDKEEAVKRWFIYDLDVTQSLDQNQLLEVPHQVYAASRTDSGWNFISRPGWTEEAKQRCKSYRWGGY